MHVTGVELMAGTWICGLAVIFAPGGSTFLAPNKRAQRI